MNKIDRGVEQACGGVPDFAGHGCGLRFCERHLDYSYTADGMDDLVDEKGESYPRRCERCIEGREPFAAKEDHPEWIAWKLSDASWLGWRTENPQEVDRLKRVLAEVR
ncbi:hypothetical protein [Mycobacteroides abscessus]|uniref:hypothetical protein n=1 Tax=Mycobacteroides abscessus TaxID=36809 RepID=UPI002104A484|nr:hypothetical protein [Mycobacteroides abscessus]